MDFSYMNLIHIFAIRVELMVESAIYILEWEYKMDWGNIIRDLAWPVTAIIFLFTVKKEILPLVQSILPRLKKVKYKDAELEFLSREANESLAKFAHGGYTGTVNIRAIFETVKLNEWATLVLSRMLMRKGLLEIVGKDHCLGSSPSLEKLISQCESGKKIPIELINDLKKLRSITFYAEWWGGDAPNKIEWKWALDNCEGIIQNLFDHQAVA